MAFQRYAVIQGGQVTAVISWAGDDAPAGLAAGTTLMPEADAVSQGIPSAVPAGKSHDLATAAIQANRANMAQDQALVATAQTLANGSGALTNAQLTAAVRQLATAVIVLARNDAQANRQLIALILHQLEDFDATGANTLVASTAAVTADATATVPPAVFSTP